MLKSEPQGASRSNQPMVNKTILVVDDEPSVRKVCEEVLRFHNFECILASNGEQGFEAYCQRHSDICLVLSDVSMPVMGGIEMATKLFAMHSHVNVILMSGYNMSDIVPDDVRKLCSVIPKPFTSNALIAAVRKCLKYDDDRLADAASSI